VPHVTEVAHVIFETTLRSREALGVTVTPWQTASAVGRCSSAAAARPP